MAIDRRNSGDANFLFDSTLQNDHLKEDNAIIASDNEIRLATFVDPFLVGLGSGAIGYGMLLSDGMNPGTVAISAGWAIDVTGRYVSIPTALDNIALVDAFGGSNYIAIRYSNTYASPRVARGNGVEYNTTITDSYTLDIAGAQQAYGMPNYWIRLGVARRNGAGVGAYHYNSPHRTGSWRQQYPPFERTYGWSDGAGAAPAAIAIPNVETWLYHQGVSTEAAHFYYAGFVDRLYVETSIAPTQDITWRVKIAGVTAFSLVQLAAATTANVQYDPWIAAASYHVASGQTIHVTAQGAAATAAVQAIACVGGKITGW